MPSRSSNLAVALPLSQAQLALVHSVTDALDGTGLAWLSGYAAGIAQGRFAHVPPTHAAKVTEAAPGAPLTIVYGSQTGNARRVAERIAHDADSAGLAVRLLRADAYPLRELKDERHLYLVVSTQGDGDPSDDARELFDHITGKRAPRLAQLQYAVLGLGDSSYPRFCAVGEILDARLAELGAQRLLPRGDADLDIDTVGDPWREQAIAKAKETIKPLATVTPLRPAQPATAPSGFDRDRPFQAELLANQRITAGTSRKDVRHIELSLAGSGLQYQPGDALGVWPRNPGPLVDAVLDTLKLDGDTPVTQDAQTKTLRDWLESRRELTRLARPFVAAHAARNGDNALTDLLEPGNAALAPWMGERQVIDLLRQHPADWTADALVSSLRPLLPRLYSIASSQAVVGDEVHLTVAHVAYRRDGESRWGAASHLLAAGAEGDMLPVYIEPNERFRLPADASRDVIMIGPGTGVAPFRAFVQERRAMRTTRTGGNGRNWLFFGNPNFRRDFLYQLEWQRALKDGTLDRLDLAFSREVVRRLPTDASGIGDGGKTYVQHRLREQGPALYDWLQGGAHLYVCGAIAMGKDVHATLLDIATTSNGGDRDAATDWLDALAREGRYARDVY